MIPAELPLIGPTLTVLDFAGMAVFAATGALAGARLRQDLVTIAFFAAVTGVGGGTLRDLLIGAPVFWVQDWRYVAVALAAAVLVWFVGGRGWRLTALLWLDAVGLAAYGVLGAAKSMAYGVPPLIDRYSTDSIPAAEQRPGSCVRSPRPPSTRPTPSSR